MNSNPTQYELLKMHIDALYVLDTNGSLCTVNEPWDKSAPACRFFLGRTLDGHSISRFRFDTPSATKIQINELCKAEPIPNKQSPIPTHLNAYLKQFGSENWSISLCYYVPPLAQGKNVCVGIDADNVASLTRKGFEWLQEEIVSAQPCTGLVLCNQIVSVCRSVRITEHAHEAGIETLDTFRGNGYAIETLAAWEKAVRSKGTVPLYSTTLENKSSQRIAEKAGLFHFGFGFSVF